MPAPVAATVCGIQKTAMLPFLAFVVLRWLRCVTLWFYMLLRQSREDAHVMFPCEGARVTQQQLRVDPLHGIPHGRRRNRQGPRRGRPRPQNHQLQVYITSFSPSLVVK